jgi:hypothetical protein
LGCGNCLGCRREEGERNIPVGLKDEEGCTSGAGEVERRGYELEVARERRPVVSGDVDRRAS